MAVPLQATSDPDALEMLADLLRDALDGGDRDDLERVAIFARSYERLTDAARAGGIDIDQLEDRLREL